MIDNLVGAGRCAPWANDAPYRLSSRAPSLPAGCTSGRARAAIAVANALWLIGQRRGVVVTITLGAALEAFILEHEYCGELDSAVETDRVWMTCTCGALIVQALGPVPVP